LNTLSLPVVAGHQLVAAAVLVGLELEPGFL
jgi:hypothetical protein